jgi:hypothetical protein
MADLRRRMLAEGIAIPEDLLEDDNDAMETCGSAPTTNPSRRGHHELGFWVRNNLPTLLLLLTWSQWMGGKSAVK